MLQVAAPIWNQVAKEGMRTSLGRRMFHLSQDQLTDRIQREAENLQGRGFHPRVVRAAQTVAPLLAERHAISSYLVKHPQYSQALPEVNSVQEAIILASKEFLLTTPQQKELEKLLKAIK